jgi:tripartite-type tricarboxylate transporter receptor subunit TctC
MCPHPLRVTHFVWVLAALYIGTSYAQTFPNKPLRILTAGTGSSVDLTGRVLSTDLSATFGQPVVVDNRASSTLADLLANSVPDGYTMVIIGSSFWLSPLLEKHPTHDPLKDSAPLTLTGTIPTVIVVPSSLAVSSVKDLIALAKAKPGVLNYSSPGTGSAAHLATELFKSMAGVNVVRIDYKGGVPAINALFTGEVQVAFSSLGLVDPLIKSGRLKALAVCGIEPSKQAPGLPTVAASGLPGFDAENTNGMFVPAKTPEAIVKRLNQEIVRILSRPDVKEKLLASAGMDVRGSTPEEFGAIVAAEMSKMGKVIRDAGITLD